MSNKLGFYGVVLFNIQHHITRIYLQTPSLKRQTNSIVSFFLALIRSHRIFTSII